MTQTERKLMKVGGSLCVALPFEWVRALKASSGISHRVIGLEWSIDDPEIKLRALTVEELSMKSIGAEEGNHAVTDSVIEGDSAQVVSDSQVSSSGSE